MVYVMLITEERAYSYNMHFLVQFEELHLVQQGSQKLVKKLLETVSSVTNPIFGSRQAPLSKSASLSILWRFRRIGLLAHA